MEREREASSSRDEILKGGIVTVYSNSYILFLILFYFWNDVRHGSHWSRSLQDGLGDEWTCGTTLASAYVLCYLSATWSQLQMMGRSSRWK